VPVPPRAPLPAHHQPSFRPSACFLATSVVAAVLAAAAPARAQTPRGEDQPKAGARGTVRGAVSITRAPGAGRDPSPILIYLVGFTEPPPSATAQIIQRGKEFLPSLLGVTAGQQVAFPNGDPFYHNVFSPSAVRKFDLGQYPPGATRSRSFPKTGVVDIYCNIHPQMSATILVLPNRRFATARRDGSYAIEGVPPGTWTIYAYSRRSDKPVGKQVEVTVGAVTTVDFRVTETRVDFTHLNKYGEEYRDPDQRYP
jgi:plastocyanin